MPNPFTFRVIPADSPFCDRNQELRELFSHAKNSANVVLFSPRRYGKTSLVEKLQAQLKKDGVFTFYADFFMVTSENDVAERIARNVYAVLNKDESLLKKGARFLRIFKTFRPVFKPSSPNGFTLTVEPVSTSMSGAELLDKVMEELGVFISKETKQAHIVFDEFQEVTELKNSSVEGTLRNRIQKQRASYFFVGSRRRILLDIFNQRNRPFFQSAIMYPLRALPHDELTTFLVSQFKRGGKKCPRNVAAVISQKVANYPYYAQALAYNIYEVSGQLLREKDIETAFEKLVASERYGYEAIVQGLTGPQIALLRALATDPNSRILTAEYMSRHKLSVGGVQYAQKKLEALDLIEKYDGVWRVVDPVFASWLSTY